MEEDIEYLKELIKPPLRPEWDYASKLDKTTAKHINNLIKLNKKLIKENEKQSKQLIKKDKKIVELFESNDNQWEARCNLTFKLEYQEDKNKELETEFDATIKLLSKTNNNLQEISRTLNLTDEHTYGYVYPDIINKIKELKEKNIELTQELEKRKWVKIKDNGEVQPLFYISKDKVRELLNKYKKESFIAKVDVEELLEERN